jgi:hypothetical protein
MNQTFDLTKTDAEPLGGFPLAQRYLRDLTDHMQAVTFFGAH